MSRYRCSESALPLELLELVLEIEETLLTLRDLEVEDDEWLRERERLEPLDELLAPRFLAGGLLWKKNRANTGIFFNILGT